MDNQRLARLNSNGDIQMKWTKNYIVPFWDDQYKTINYFKRPFNGVDELKLWREDGYQHAEEYFTGYMCPHGETHPDWTDDIVDSITQKYDLNDVGVCYYRMETGVILPIHSDHYKIYRDRFNCSLSQVKRVLVFLEDWKSGHYFELDGIPIVNWKAGDYYQWTGATKHMASNIGVDDRYTLQLTGWCKK